MNRATRFVLTAAAGAAALLAPFCAVAAADVRQQGPDVQTVSHEGIVASIYPDKSYYFILPYRSQSLYMNADGSTILFDGAGQTLATGKWDAAEGSVGELKGLPAEIMGKIKTTLAYVKTVPKKQAPPPGSPSAAPEKSPTAIEWVDEKS